MVSSHTSRRSRPSRKSFNLGLWRSLLAAATSALELASARRLPYTGSGPMVSPGPVGGGPARIVGGIGTPVALGCTDARDAGLLPHAVANNRSAPHARDLTETGSAERFDVLVTTRPHCARAGAGVRA